MPQTSAALRSKKCSSISGRIVHLKYDKQAGEEHDKESQADQHQQRTAKNKNKIIRLLLVLVLVVLVPLPLQEVGGTMFVTTTRIIIIRNDKNAKE
jgi:hypothetical protein